jgi:hypothetical protein
MRLEASGQTQVGQHLAKAATPTEFRAESILHSHSISDSEGHHSVTLAKMPSPEAMFFSSPPSAGGVSRSPGDEVPQLVAKAQVTPFSPAIFVCLQNPNQKRLFLEVFLRHIQLLKSRSQAFEDAHITVYDKALLTLTRNGNELDSPAAIQYFCKEFLGIDTSGDPQVAQKALETSIKVQDTLEQGKYRSLHSQPNNGLTTPVCRNDRLMTSALKTEASVEQSYPIASPDREPKLTNLWNVYQRAKADYLVVANHQNHATATAARFLRDTAENILSYLENKTADPIMMRELNATYRMAKEAAVSLTGGKKRKFDVGEAERGMGARRGHGGLLNRSGHDGGQRYGDMRRSRSPARYSGGYGGPPAYPAAQTQPRGHSDIPFGYSRPVDSYHPY